MSRLKSFQIGLSKDINGVEWILLRGHFRHEARKDNDSDSGYYYSKGDQLFG